MSTTKKEAILDTALKLFVKNGIDATSIRAISEGANTAEGNIYRHFESKDDLAREIFLDCAKQFRAALEETVKLDTDPEDQIKALVRTIFGFSMNKQLEFCYILIVHHREEIITKDILSKPLPKDVFIEIINNGIENGNFRSVDPVLAVAWIVGMVQRSFIFVQRKITSLPQEVVVEQTIDAVMRILKN